MCILIIKPAGARLPTLEEMENCDNSNPHGGGLAYHKQGSDHVVLNKSFNRVRSMHKFMTANIGVNDVAVLHFRYATHGNKDKGNRHPYIVTDNLEHMRTTASKCEMVAAHNGVFSSWDRNSKYSDSMHFIREYIHELRNELDREIIFRMIDNIMGHSKFAVLTNTGMVYKWGKFVEDDGLFWSNSDYKTKRVRYVQPKAASIHEAGAYDYYEYLNYRRPELKDTHKGSSVYTYNKDCEFCGQNGTLKKISYDKYEYWICADCTQYMLNSKQEAGEVLKQVTESEAQGSPIDPAWSAVCMDCGLDSHTAMFDSLRQGFVCDQCDALASCAQLT